jgi:hypothetical protein
MSQMVFDTDSPLHAPQEANVSPSSTASTALFLPSPRASTSSSASPQSSPLPLSPPVPSSSSTSRKRVVPPVEHDGRRESSDVSSSSQSKKIKGEDFHFVEEVSEYEDGSGAYLVVWADGDKTWESSDFQLSINDPVKWAMLMAMASRYRDSSETLQRKAEERRLYTLGLSRGDRRSPRNHATTRAIDEQKQLKADSDKDEKQEMSPFDIPKLSINVCQACDTVTTALRCHGRKCSQHLCLHHYDDPRYRQANPPHKLVEHPLVGFYCPTHGGPPFPKTAEVTLRGLARSQLTGFHIISMDITFTSRITVPYQLVNAAEAEVVFIDTHTKLWNLEGFEKEIGAAMSGTAKVHLVFIFACWLDPAVQVKAMKEVSYKHPSITFILFRVPNLTPTTTLLNQCIQAGDQTIRYPTALSYLFLARLAVEQKDIVIFEHGSGPVRLCRMSTGLPTCECLGADGRNRSFSSGTQKWWKEGVRRKHCREGKCPGLLLIPDVIAN